MPDTGSDCLKLTAYFGERDRVSGGLLSDALMDLYAAQGLRASVILRGADGFGRLHHLRTDRMLSSSEDLPVVSVAVDERARIEALLGQVLEIQRRGLITLERARLLSGGPGAGLQGLAGESGEPGEPGGSGEELKLTVYMARHERVQGVPAHVAACAMLHEAGLTGATVLLGVDGTRDGQRSRARFFASNAGVPMLLVAIGPAQRLAAQIPELSRMLSEAPMTLERVRVCKRDGEFISGPRELPGTDEHGLALWQKLTIHTPHDAMHTIQPLHLEILSRLQRETAVAGVTVLRGIWGFHGDHAPYGDRILQVRRHVPVMTTIVDTPERIREAYPIVDAITARRGLVTSEMVPAARALSAQGGHGGLRLARYGLWGRGGGDAAES